VADAWRANLEWAREFARQPADVMVKGASTFLGVLQHAGAGEPELWAGFEKLANHALAGQDKQAAALRQRLLVVVDHVAPPAEMQALVQRLRSGH
jgi:hypothetical protein